MNPSTRFTWSSLAISTLLSLGACGGDSNADPSCTPGEFGCECNAGQCLAGLVCEAGVCTSPSGSSTTDTTADTSTGDDSSTDTSTTGGETGSVPGGPEVTDISLSTLEITQGESILITAQVTDPDGLDDIVGGSLRSEDLTLTLGNFTQLSPGLYEISLGWDAIQAAQDIVFDVPLERSFLAVFSDTSANEGTRSVNVGLTCGSGAACEPGICNPLTDWDSCGSCTHECTVFFPDVGLCTEEQTCSPTFGECLTIADMPDMTCNQYCSSIGETCALCPDINRVLVAYGAPDTCEGDGNRELHPDGGNCDAPLSPSGGNTHARCCCTQ